VIAIGGREVRPAEPRREWKRGDRQRIGDGDREPGNLGAAATPGAVVSLLRARERERGLRVEGRIDLKQQLDRDQRGENVVGAVGVSPAAGRPARTDDECDQRCEQRELLAPGKQGPRELRARRHLRDFVKWETRPANNPLLFVRGGGVTGRDGERERVETLEEQRPPYETPEGERGGPGGVRLT